MPYHRLLVRQSHWLLATILLAVLSNGATAQDRKRVSAFDAPPTFAETFAYTGVPVIVEDVPTGQSPQTETDAFVYFLDENDRMSPGDRGSMALLTMFMYQSQGTGFLQRGRVERPEISTVVVVVRMFKTERSRLFMGCLAALEVLRAFDLPPETSLTLM